MIMRQHGPEPQQRRGRDANAKLRQISFQERVNELPAPRHTFGIGTGKKGARKRTAQPMSVKRRYPDLRKAETGKRDRLKPTRQRLRRLSHKFGRRAPPKQETVPATACGPPARAVPETAPACVAPRLSPPPRATPPAPSSARTGGQD